MKTIKLSECTLGAVVASTDDDRLIGHIVGFDKNVTGEAIPVVLWAGKSVSISIHHSNIKLFKD